MARLLPMLMLGSLLASYGCALKVYQCPEFCADRSIPGRPPPTQVDLSVYKN